MPQLIQKPAQVNLQKREQSWIPLEKPLGEIGPNISQDYKAIVLGLRDYVLKSNFWLKLLSC